jgi:hypothetical protein
MRNRPGFARLLPLMALIGLAAGTFAPLVSARVARSPLNHVDQERRWRFRSSGRASVGVAGCAPETRLHKPWGQQ